MKLNETKQKTQTVNKSKSQIKQNQPTKQKNPNL